jgi:hypothetical protein
LNAKLEAQAHNYIDKRYLVSWQRTVHQCMKDDNLFVASNGNKSISFVPLALGRSDRIEGRFSTRSQQNTKGIARVRWEHR